MNIKLRIASLSLAMILPVAGFADDAQPVASSAEHWLNLQRNQSLASAQPQAASALAREKSMERLFKTYDQAIPDKYFSDSFKSGQ